MKLQSPWVLCNRICNYILGHLFNPYFDKKNITLIYECLLKKQPLGCTAEAVSSWLLQRPCANATEAAFKIWAKNPHHFKKPHTHV
jgi:hypothetical protein